MTDSNSCSDITNCAFKKKLVLTGFLLILFIITAIMVTPDYLFIPKYKFVYQPEIQSKLGDFQYYYFGGFMLHYRNPYIYDKEKFEMFFKGAEVTKDAHRYLNYPPLIYCLLSPFAVINVLTASKIWYYFNHILLMGSLLFLFFSTKTREGDLKFKTGRFIFYAIFTLIFSPTIDNLLQGQVNILILFLLTGTLFCHSRGLKILAGLFLGFAISLKIFPAILLLFFLIRKEYRIMSYTLLSIFLIHLTIAFLWSPVLIAQYFTNIFANYASLSNIYVFANQSIIAALHRLFSIVPLSAEENSIPILNAPFLIAPLRIIISLAIIAIISFFTWKTRDENPGSDSPNLVFALFVASIVTLSPMVWVHHLILLLLALPIYLEYVYSSFYIKKAKFFSIIILAIMFQAIASFDGWVSFVPRFTQAYLRAWFNNSNLPTLCIVIIWIMMAVIAFLSLKTKNGDNESKAGESENSCIPDS